MAKDEVVLIEEEIKPKEVKTKPIEQEEFKPDDRVKAIFKNNGIETEYFGTVKKITRTGLILTEFDDGDKQYMRSTELELVS